MDEQNQPPPATPIAYATPSSRSDREKAFWWTFLLFGGFLALLSLGSLFRDKSLWVVLNWATLVAWLAAVVCHVEKARLQYVAIGLWLLLTWPRQAYVVARYVHFALIVGEEGPGGYGSPLAFELGFCFEVVLFLPLTILLAYFVRTRLWRSTNLTDG
jgi:hypothetical protein